MSKQVTFHHFIDVTLTLHILKADYSKVVVVYKGGGGDQ